MPSSQDSEAQQSLQGRGSIKQTWGEYGRQVYNEQYEIWIPWIESLYLRWFTRDNKASYATKDTLDKSKITGVTQVDKLQDTAHGTIAGQLGQNGLLRPLGDAVSTHGVDRAERGGTDESGHYAPGAAGTVLGPLVEAGSKVGGGLVDGGKTAGGYVSVPIAGRK